MLHYQHTSTNHSKTHFLPPVNAAKAPEPGLLFLHQITSGVSFPPKSAAPPTTTAPLFFPLNSKLLGKGVFHRRIPHQLQSTRLPTPGQHQTGATSTRAFFPPPNSESKFHWKGVFYQRMLHQSTSSPAAGPLFLHRIPSRAPRPDPTLILNPCETVQ